jgi:hypothetical protein
LGVVEEAEAGKGVAEGVVVVEKNEREEKEERRDGISVKDLDCLARIDDGLICRGGKQRAVKN